jgi:hypothetical protein
VRLSIEQGRRCGGRQRPRHRTTLLPRSTTARPAQLRSPPCGPSRHLSHAVKFPLCKKECRSHTNQQMGEAFDRTGKTMRLLPALFHSQAPSKRDLDDPTAQYSCSSQQRWRWGNSRTHPFVSVAAKLNSKRGVIKQNKGRTRGAYL